mmetsp:Transcript_5744/g.20622  ORF Transcript_5744/g.20622 Transcript_5744/m.20622 type:complete len:279 (-) Transcript_5744:300-1136(-)
MRSTVTSVPSSRLTMGPHHSRKSWNSCGPISRLSSVSSMLDSTWKTMGLRASRGPAMAWTASAKGTVSLSSPHFETQNRRASGGAPVICRSALLLLRSRSAISRVAVAVACKFSKSTSRSCSSMRRFTVASHAAYLPTPCEFLATTDISRNLARLQRVALRRATASRQACASVSCASSSCCIRLARSSPLATAAPPLAPGVAPPAPPAAPPATSRSSSFGSAARLSANSHTWRTITPNSSADSMASLHSSTSCSTWLATASTCVAVSSAMASTRAESA